MSERAPRRIVGSSERPVDAIEVVKALQEASSARMRDEWEKEYAIKRVAESYAYDSLTNARTRGYGEDELERELRIIRGEEQRSGAEKFTTLSVVMIDLDHFKQINDVYGHPVGDQVLRETVAIAKEVVRDDSDTVVRWGGDEFLILMPNASAEVAEAHANEIREKLEGLSFSDGEFSFSVTASFGVASSEKTTDKDALVKCADAALYIAKKTERNKVVVDTQPSNEPLRTTSE